MAELGLEIAFARGRFTLEVRERLELAGITTLFGPSGSGKTTLLRIVSGLETGAAGTVRFDDEDWQRPGRHVPTHRRRIGYVFQDGRLFPHLDVEGNLRFGLRAAGERGARDRAAIRFENVVTALDLEPLLDRRPVSLSGGEQQRVAIGRALLANPRLLLMDEPMSSLDVRRKAEILPYIERLPDAFGLPVLYVTHSIDEVARLASEVVLLADGRVVGRGPVGDVLERIDFWPLTGHAEAGTLVDGIVDEASNGMASIRLGTQRLRVPLRAAPVGKRVRLRIFARDVAIATEPPRGLSIRNVLAARILEIVPTEPVHVELLLEVDGRHVRSRITREALAELGLAAGQHVYALIKSVALEERPFDDDR
ncbi:MAG: molybdenum ABC transporter ATP-binding protein [Gammaproteobacteria bacterium]